MLRFLLRKKNKFLVKYIFLCYNIKAFAISEKGENR